MKVNVEKIISTKNLSNDKPKENKEAKTLQYLDSSFPLTKIHNTF